MLAGLVLIRCPTGRSIQTDDALSTYTSASKTIQTTRKPTITTNFLQTKLSIPLLAPKLYWTKPNSRKETNSKSLITHYPQHTSYSSSSSRYPTWNLWLCDSCELSANTWQSIARQTKINELIRKYLYFFMAHVNLYTMTMLSAISRALVCVAKWFEEATN